MTADLTNLVEDGVEATSPEPVRADAPSRRSRRWILPALAVIGVGAIAIWMATSGSDAEGAGEVAVAQNFADAVRTDLVEQSSYDATLGRVDGETIVSRTGGTVTSVPDPGTTITPGDVLFDVDGQPIVLLEGTVPAWRSMGIDAASESYTGAVSGTVTSTLDVGTTVQQGDVLYTVDNEPVVALYGDTPAYRTMREDDEGPDVLQLEEALVALGYDPDAQMTVDGVYTSYTESLVALWQEDLGIEETGTVDLGTVVFIPGPALVTAVDAPVGQSIGASQPVVSLATGEPMVGADVAQLEAALAAAGYDVGSVDGEFDAETRAAVVAWQTDIGAEADGVVDLGEVVFLADGVRVSDNLVALGGSINQGGGVLAVTSQATLVSLDLPAEDQGVLEEGMAVEVELPDGEVVPATVTSVSTVATVSGANETVFEVSVELDDPADAGNLEEAPVEVLVVSDSVSDVVAVPVTALIALAEGGYAVEVQAGDGTRYVAVDPGFFADGLVEVTGSEIEAGDKVVVP